MTIQNPTHEAPLVSCIMPTADRRPFVERAIQYFLCQDYSDKELIIVDDGADPVIDLVPSDSRIRYIRLDKKATVGAKRNIACEQARGTIIVHWDDDDWHAPHQLHYQVDSLLQKGADLCGINILLFYDIRTGEAWQYKYPPGQKLWLSGSSLCYRRSFWERNKFANINVGEDGRFVWRGDPGQMVVLSDFRFHVGIIHDKNVSPKRTRSPYWTQISTSDIRDVLGNDWDRYRNLNGSRHVDCVRSLMVVQKREDAQ